MCLLSRRAVFEDTMASAIEVRFIFFIALRARLREQGTVECRQIEASNESERVFMTPFTVLL